MEKLSSSQIHKHLKYSGNINFHIYETIDSTNLRAKEAALMGEPELSVFVSQSQSAGRGRLGRSFYSPPGTGLYMTMIIRPKENALINLATIYAGAAVSKAIETHCGINTRLKWVNDIFANGKKVCGILAEAVTGKSGIEAIVIGIGVNLKTPPDGFPDEIKTIAGALDTDISAEKLCAAITDELINISELGFYPEVLDHYRQRDLLLGMHVDYTKAGEKKSGKAIGINDAGALLIETSSGEIDELSYGEATIGSSSIKTQKQ